MFYDHPQTNDDFDFNALYPEYIQRFGKCRSNFHINPLIKFR